MTTTPPRLRPRRAAGLLAVTAALLCSLLLASTAPARAAAADTPHQITTFHGAQIWYGAESYGYKCPNDWVCIWYGQDFTSYAIFYPAPAGLCHGWRFEDSIWQDHTYSIWNRTTGWLTIWDRAHDGSYNYTKYGYIGDNYLWGDTPFSYIMDGWIYDENNTCTTPTFVYHVTWRP